jgi:tetratricopeptide (TPR) repeat protein
MFTAVDGNLLAYAAAGGVVKLCELVSGQERARFIAQGDDILGITFSFDSKRLAVRRPGCARFWDITTRQELGTISTGTQPYTTMALAPDGRTVAFGGAIHTTDLTLWTVDTQQVQTTLKHVMRACAAIYSPDARSLVTTDQDGHIQFWNARTLAKEHGFTAPTGSSWFGALAFSPDGKTLVASAPSGWLGSFDAGTGRLLARFSGLTSPATSVAVFPDGKTLVSGDDHGTVKLWDLSTGQERFALAGRQGKGVSSVAVAPDGKTVATVEHDGPVKLWRAALDEEASARKPEMDVDDPDGPAALINEGHGLLNGGGLDAAAEAYDKAEARLSKLAAAFPDVFEYRYVLVRCRFDRGLAYARAGRSESALADFSKAIELRPEEAGAQQQRASLYFQLGQWDKAIADFAKVLEMAPNSANDQNNLAWLLATCAEPRLRDPRRAVELAKKAVELAPTEGTNWNMLGIARYRAGDWKAATAALEKSIALRKGGDSFDWFFLARARRRRGDEKGARELYDQAVQWMEKNQPKDEELVRFRAEAENVLELKKSSRSSSESALKSSGR